MSQVAARTAPYAVAACGQSLNLVPGPSATWLYKLMDGTGIPNSLLPAVTGSSWTNLLVTQTLLLGGFLKSAIAPVIVLQGGQGDIWGNDTGAQVYADMGAYADAARALNAATIVIAHTIVPNGINTFGAGSQDERRQDANTLIIADAGNKFDAYVDLAANANLQDYANTTYYASQVHWEGPATTIVADLTEPVLYPYIGL